MYTKEFNLCNCCVFYFTLLSHNIISCTLNCLTQRYCEVIWDFTNKLIRLLNKSVYLRLNNMFYLIWIIAIYFKVVTLCIWNRYDHKKYLYLRNMLLLMGVKTHMESQYLSQVLYTQFLSHSTTPSECTWISMMHVCSKK